MATDDPLMEKFLKREYSLAQPYNGFSSYSPWELKGTALVTAEYVRLTPDQPHRQGAIWSRNPLLLYGWELMVHFKIHGRGKTYMAGDGFAIWLTKERMEDGLVFGSRNNFTGLGVFVDTFPNFKKNNWDYPRVSVMLGNGILSYDHDSDGRSTELGSCSAKVRNSRDGAFILIRYTRNRLKIMTAMRAVDGGGWIWKDCTNITGVHLPAGNYLGASAATGELSDYHDIISMKLYELTVDSSPEENLHTQRSDDKNEFQVDSKEKQMSGIQLLALFFIILGLCALVVGGSKFYRRWEEKKRKRFY
ncbi:lectin, mannose-binding 2-like b [Syngnathus acus]|uniref:lectin, mannose-binding 2-like b n=1 Tax=Syngnathus acus TaxID=161584 RepID=UPI001885AB16|nr:lectin, mannose-binding 2-like b [Syngnathus acus]